MRVSSKNTARAELAPASSESRPAADPSAPAAVATEGPTRISGASAAEVVKGLALAEANRVASGAFVDLKRQADKKLEEQSPKTKAVLDAVGPHAAGLIALTAKEMANDPETVKKLAELSAKVGKNGFSAAMKKVGPDASRAFAKAAGVEAMNPVVVAKLLDNLPSLAAKVSPKLSGKVAKHCLALEAKLGVKAALKTGATAGKAAPAIGNAIAVASTVLAATSLLKSLTTKDPEKICKEGCNTLLQAVGIAFPWVALGGDLVDLGWTAKIALEETDGGKPSKNAAPKEAGKLLSEISSAAQAQAEAIGDDSLAKALADFVDATKDVTNQKQVEKASQEALKRLAQSASTTFSEQAKELPEGKAKEDSALLAQSFSELFTVVLHHQKASKVSDASRLAQADQLLSIQEKLAQD